MSRQENDRGLARAELLRISRQITSSHGPRGRPVASTELVLMNVDPVRLHAYWHIDHADLFHARVAAGDPCASLVLRMCEPDPASGECEPLSEHPVSSLTDARYLEAPSSGGACQVEIGLKLRDGSVRPMVRSAVVRPPPSAATTHYEMVPVDTRLRPPAEDPGVGDGMPGPLPQAESAPPGSSRG